ncbi:MAG: hypothetical protein KatS3mg051_1040 [Anaerolineae bacterium]|nr:MAG: hypothetical protein KatS3mg051_1040 [Anaerolineae bacterium]
MPAHIVSEFNSDRLRALRLGAGLSLEQLARNARLPESTLRSWERARHNPLSDGLAALARALNVEPAELCRPNPEPADDMPGIKEQRRAEKKASVAWLNGTLAEFRRRMLDMYADWEEFEEWYLERNGHLPCAPVEAEGKTRR